MPEHQPIHEEHQPLPQGKRRSGAWIIWAALTAVFAAVTVAIQLSPDSSGVGGGLIVTALAGLYTFYLFRGGRIVVVPMRLVIIILVFAILFAVSLISRMFSGNSL